MAWTPEQIAERQKNLIQNMQRLADLEDPECTDFWKLLGYRDAITPEIQRAALDAEVFYPSELFYRAPEDVRDGMIHALLSTEDSGEVSPIRIGRVREYACLHCGGQMVDMLVLDGRDERLKFLGLNGILTAACCPNCVGFLKGPAYNRFTLDGDVEVFPSELFDGAGKMDCYVRPEDYKALTGNTFVLGKSPVPLFYGASCEDVNTIGGFAN